MSGTWLPSVDQIRARSGALYLGREELFGFPKIHRPPSGLVAGRP